MILKKKRRLVFFLICIGFFLTACGKSLSFIESDPSKLEVVIRTSADVNPDDQGRASPIVVLLYELKTLGNFDVADFSGLYKDDDQLLGGDLVHREKFHLPVSGSAVYKTELSLDTRFIAVVAAYRQLNRSIWKTYLPISTKDDIRLDISVGHLGVLIKTP